jgi:hypothetical protein
LVLFKKCDNSCTGGVAIRAWTICHQQGYKCSAIETSAKMLQRTLTIRVNLGKGKNPAKLVM